MEDNSTNSGTSQNSLVREDLPTDGFADDELELARKRLIEERKNGFRKYAEDRLHPESEGFE
jgi:hypothetical protein